VDVTPERKQQIEQEEHQRFAEEQYRAALRSGLLADAGRRASPEARGRWRAVPLAVGVVVVVCAVAFAITNLHPAPVSASPITPSSKPAGAVQPPSDPPSALTRTGVGVQTNPACENDPNPAGCSGKRLVQWSSDSQILATQAARRAANACNGTPKS